jgi:cytochrome c peroxidase
VKNKLIIGFFSFSLLAYVAWNFLPTPSSINWSETQIQLLQSLSLEQLPPLPEDPSNLFANNEAAAELGHVLYFDERISSNNAVACATCHQPEKMFTDGLALAVGVASGPRHTPSLVGVSYSPWFYWDGRKDSQWAQALAPIEAAHEHNSDRLQVARLITTDANYRAQYGEIFGPLPAIPDSPIAASPLGDDSAQAAWSTLSIDQQNEITRVFSNLGKALAAYQRKLIPGRTRFDDYVDALPSTEAADVEVLTSSELAGLDLFIGDGQCVTCHNGPLLTNHDFHNTGVLAVRGELPPMGRYDGIRTARQDPFNCLGEFSDASRSECIELRFSRDSNDLVGAQKTPSLRNIKDTAPYMHGGQITTLREVVEHYNEAPTSMLSHNEAKPLGLRSVQLRQLEDFLETLSAPLATDSKWLNPPTP